MTNGDRLRASTNEELLKELMLAVFWHKNDRTNYKKVCNSYGGMEDYLRRYLETTVKCDIEQYIESCQDCGFCEEIK